MHAATVAAVPFLIPVAHIAGGALTLGAIDDSLRHSITKMSSLHFAETEEYARRVVQMGEEPWRVIVTGALALENLRQMDLLSFEELRRRYGLKSEEPPLLVTFHPVTRQHAQTKHHVTELLAALAGFDLPVVFTYPNADTSGRQIIPMIDEFVSRNRQSQAIANLGTLGYFSLMKHSVAMVGNSSSGIVEAPSFKLPVVNIGDRQKGRTAAANVISVGHHREDIRAGTREAISPQFNDRLTDLVNPYEGDRPSEAIVNTLKSVPIDGALLEKEFYDQRILAAVP
jgi:UDP-hydrolysing UDP-N-acetyl-D-glucosamine 2-epimerase